MKFLVLPCLVSLVVASDSPLPQTEPTTTAAELEARFEQKMSGSVLVGHFTESGSSEEPREERYTIAKVTKVRDDRWRFDAKIEYGGKSVTVPIVVPVRWAGDTPVISVTDMNIPMLGKYSARVMIYDDQYAGMWSGGEHGGLMYGRIERANEDAAGRGNDDGAGWPNWRGPNRDGVSPNGNPPTSWSEEENIRWKVAVPGKGSSSPIIWQDRIYLTTAIETDVEGKPAAAEEESPEPEARPESRRRSRGRRSRRGRGGFGFGGAPPTKIHEFVVMALDRKDGSVVWKTVVKEAVPHEAGHRTASQASGSPLTDGEHIIAQFGSRGLYCLDMDGEVQWSKEFGPMRTRMGFGEGSSPALQGDVLAMTWDHEDDSFIVAFDKSSGEELWRKERDEATSWATPFIVSVNGSSQIITSATRASRAYDLMTGEEVWRCSGMTSNCIPTPVYRDGVIYLMSGFRGNKLQAIRLDGAKGDITDTDHVLWSHGQGTSYTPSALLYDDNLYFLRTNNGVLSCLDRNTGEAHYEGQRLPDMREVYSSPVGAAGRVYVTSRGGTTVVLEHGAEYVELATNELDDGFDASAAIVGDELYLRGQKHLYCIAEN